MHLGTVSRVHEDWFDENNDELRELIHKRNRARADMLTRSTRSNKSKFRVAGRKLTERCRKLKNDWWLAKAAELQRFADTNDMKGSCQGMKTVWVQESILTSFWPVTAQHS